MFELICLSGVCVFLLLLLISLVLKIVNENILNKKEINQ